MISHLKTFVLSLLSASVALSLLLFSVTARSDDTAPPTPQERHAKFHEAFQACLQENNLTPPTPETRPNKAERKLMHTCLASKGFKHHRHHHHHNGEETPVAS